MPSDKKRDYEVGYGTTPQSVLQKANPAILAAGRRARKT